ncbi:protoporphyrinogen oxidase [Thermostilla marina]
MTSGKPKRVAVIGAGISGLAAAWKLVCAGDGVSVTVFEAADRPGGVLSTVEADGFQVEQSADNFITTVPWGVRLCRELGLEQRLCRTSPQARKTYVVCRRRLHPLPEGFLMMAPTKMWPLATTPILSPAGKLRAAMEYFLPPRRDDEDESMAHFVRRRLGREVFDRLVEPLISAVYAADMEKLSVLATLPRFREMERRHGSLIRAMRHQMRERRRKAREAAAKEVSSKGTQSDSGARFSMFVALRGGMGELVAALWSRLEEAGADLRLGTPVTRVQREASQWHVEVDGRPSEAFDAVIVAVPASVASPLLKAVDAELSDQLASIDYSGTAIVSMGFRRDQVRHPLDGAGCVVPAVEKSPLLALSFSSSKYPFRAPDDCVLVRAFTGGARDEKMVTESPERIRDLVLPELRTLLGIHGDPVFENISRWPGTMPQYHVGHRERTNAIFEKVAAHAGLALAGNAYYGVGVPHCIRSGQEAACRVLGIEPEDDGMPRFGTA